MVRATFLDLIPKEYDPPPVSEMIRVADETWRAIVGETWQAIERLRSGDFTEVAKLDAMVKELKAAGRLALEERARSAKLGSTVADAGPSGPASFDLDRARDEIMGRLAKIRAAG